MQGIHNGGPLISDPLNQISENGDPIISGGSFQRSSALKRCLKLGSKILAEPMNKSGNLENPKP